MQIIIVQLRIIYCAWIKISDNIFIIIVNSIYIYEFYIVFINLNF